MTDTTGTPMSSSQQSSTGYPLPDEAHRMGQQDLQVQAQPVQAQPVQVQEVQVESVQFQQAPVEQAAMQPVFEQAQAVANAVVPMQPETPQVQVKKTFSTFADKPKNNLIVSAIALVIIAIFGAWEVFPNSYDNDVWFFLATGEYIVEHGIPYTNPFSLHEGLDIVVQQWLHCVISYLIYKAAGFIGLGLWTMFLFAVMVFSMYRVSRIIRDNTYGSECMLILMIPTIVVLSPYSSMRPHLYTMIFFTWIVGLLFLYRRTSQIRYLIPLPFLVLLHVNIHSSMAVFDLVIMVCFVIPDVLKPLHDKGKLRCIQFANINYRRLPLLSAIFVCALMLLINPYGLDGALYVINSMGAASYKNYISEMNPLVPARNAIYVLVTCFLIVTAIVVGRKGAKKIDLAMLLLIVGCGVMTFTHVRNLWLGPIFCFYYLIWASSSLHIKQFADLKTSRIIGAVICAIGLMACVAIMIIKSPMLAEEPENDESTPVAAMDYLDEIGADKEKTRILNFFNSGGYIEYRGYYTVIDPRPELWSPNITHNSFDYYKEFVDMSNGDTYVDEYIDKYGLNVYIVPKEDGLIDTMKDQNTYLEISGGEGYRAFILKSAYEEITGQDISTAPDPILRESRKGK